jgi:catechol 2,3-dioxygenase-like lactoylglutathione lyase family enzyme
MPSQTRRLIIGLFIAAAVVAAATSTVLLIRASAPALASADQLGTDAASADETAHFHHVHLNVVDPDSTMAYYEKFFGANRVVYRDRADALFTEKSFILMNEVPTPPRDNFGTSLWHIGWAGVHGPTEFEWREAEGIGIQTPVTPLGDNFYMYFWGPDRELVEVYTGSKNHRFEHVHLLPTDIEATISWFREHFGFEPNRLTRPFRESIMRTNTIRIDNVNLIMFEVPPAGGERNPILPDSVGPNFDVTEGRAMDHVAFSYADIRPVYERMAASGVEIVRPISTDEEFGLTSFFIRGPDGLLVEVVEEKPVPEGIWR